MNIVKRMVGLDSDAIFMPILRLMANMFVSSMMFRLCNTQLNLLEINCLSAFYYILTSAILIDLYSVKRKSSKFLLSLESI